MTQKIETRTISRRTALKSAVAGLAGASMAVPALAQQATQWRLVTSWPKNLPGPGVTAQRIADRITAMSGGRLTVKLYSAGELVPPFQVFDAVSTGGAEMAHTASFFWQGKLPAAAFFTAVPFGLTPMEHNTWIEHGGGQDLWSKLYAPFGVRPMMGGNTGFQMGGWYRKEIRSLEDIKGLKIRMPGLGGEIMRKLGATPVSLPPSEILPALQAGTIDATEFLGPWSDLAMGFYKVTKLYYHPGFHEPNGTGEALISQAAYDKLSDDLKAIVDHAIAAENAYALAESEWHNAGRLADLTSKYGVRLMEYPAPVLEAAHKAGEDVLASFADKDAISGEIYSSFIAARERLSPWSRLSIGGFLAARG